MKKPVQLKKKVLWFLLPIIGLIALMFQNFSNTNLSEVERREAGARDYPGFGLLRVAASAYGYNLSSFKSTEQLVSTVLGHNASGEKIKIIQVPTI